MKTSAGAIGRPADLRGNHDARPGGRGRHRAHRPDESQSRDASSAPASAVQSQPRRASGTPLFQPESVIRGWEARQQPTPEEARTSRDENRGFPELLPDAGGVSQYVFEVSVESVQDPSVAGFRGLCPQDFSSRH